MDAQDATNPQHAGRRPLLHWLGLSLGVVLVVAGVAVLANVAWQLWGTGIATAHAQHRLGQQFKAATAATKTTTQNAAADIVPSAASAHVSVPLGTLVGHLVIPKISVNDYVVEGVGSAQLAEGPGHYPGTAAIGQRGNVGIAGHRTTHGAPFYNLNDLRAGDLIYLTNTANQTFIYRVTSKYVVSPHDRTVLNSTVTPALTLTTCNPRYSAAQRLIVRAAIQA